MANKYKIEWQSDQGLNYTLTIDNEYASTYKELQPGLSPFVLNTEKDDDLFKPIRTQTGMIQVVTESLDMADVIGDSPFSRPIQLTCNSSLVWKGFLQSQAFSQTWDRGENSISIPVTSPIGLLSTRKPSNAVDDLDYITFADFIDQACLLEGKPIYQDFIFPKGMFSVNSFTTDSDKLNPLRFKFNMLNYASWNSSKKAYDVWSYYDILEDIARLFGWQIIEYGETLCFLFADKPGDYIRMTRTQLHNITTTPSQNVVTLPHDTISHEIWSDDHTVTFIPGKSKVTAVNEIVPLDETIYQLDIEGEEMGQYQQKYVDLGGTYLYYFSRSYINDQDSVIATLHSNTNIRYNAWASIPEAITSGCCIVRERQFVTNAVMNNNTNYGTLQDTGWVNRILFRLNTVNPSSIMFRITVPNLFFHGLPTEGYYLALSGTVRYSTSPSDEWQNFTGYLEFDVKIGNTTAILVVYVQNGTIKGGQGIHIGYADDSFNFDRFFETGHIIIEMPYPGNLNHNHYYSIEDLGLKYILGWDSEFSGTVVNPNQKSYSEEITTPVKLEDEYELSSRLHFYHAPNPLSLGLITANNVNDNVGYPAYQKREVVMAYRLRDYYQQTRTKIEPTLKCNGAMYEPWLLHKPGTADELQGMVCLAQQIDFARDEVSADLYDVSTN